MASTPERGDGRAAFRLVQEIIKLSEADSWAAAKPEWEHYDLYLAGPDDPHRCLCGHFPIIECCVLRNWRNSATAIVGNVCVTKVLGIPVNLIFRGLGRVRQDADAALNKPAVDYAFSKGWVDDWDRRFCLDTLRQRTLSFRQRAKRQLINAKVLKALLDSSPEAEHA